MGSDVSHVGATVELREAFHPEQTGTRRAYLAPRSGASSLDTTDITRHFSEAKHGPDGRWLVQPVWFNRAWVRKVGEITKPFRIEKGRILRATSSLQGFKAKQGTLEPGESNGKWHLARAKGWEERPARVEECQQTEHKLHVSCNECGVVVTHRARCGTGLWCASCRGKIARRKRQQLRRARRVVLHEAKRLGLLHKNRRGGRYSEKFATFTIPQLARMTLEDRWNALHEGWERLLRWINRWLEDNGHSETVHWFRTKEWTPGSDGEGHPHIHLWFFGPFLPQELLKAWWMASLRKSGFSEAELESMLVPDIRSASGDIEHELIKYLTKDIVARGEKVDAATYARLIVALDGRRQTQGSRGLMKLGKRACRCRECKSEGSLTVRMVYATALDAPVDSVDSVIGQSIEAHPP